MPPTTPITTPFGFESTAAEVVAGVDLTGRRAIVTGGASGIGVETARALAGAGAEVTLAVRDTAAGERTAADIAATTGDAAVAVAPPGPRRPGLGRRVRRRLERPAAPARQQRRRDGDPRPAAHARALGDAVRHEPPRPLRARRRPARRARGRRRRADRRGQLGRPPALAGRVRRPALRVPRLRPRARLRPVQDGERAVRGRGHPPLGGATASPRTPCIRARSPTPTSRATWTRRSSRACARAGSTATRRSSRAPRRRCWWRRRPHARRHRRALLRALRRGLRRRRADDRARRRRRRRLRARPGHAERLWEASTELVEAARAARRV